MKNSPNNLVPSIYGGTESIGSLIKESRLKRGMSQKELASKTDVSPVQLCRIEADECRPTRPTLQKLSPYLGIPFPELLVRAGYNNAMGDAPLYNKKGCAIDVARIVSSIYKADSDLLEYFSGFEEFGSAENVMVLKSLLTAMRKEVKVWQPEADEKKWLVEYFTKSFAALKSFIISSLEPIVR